MAGQSGASDGLGPCADAAAIRDEQAGRALRRLAERGDLTPRQRAAVERLADRLATEVTALFEADQSPVEQGDAGEAECGVVSSD